MISHSAEFANVSFFLLIYELTLNPDIGDVWLQPLKICMSKLALGTVQFGLPYGIANRIGQVQPNEVREMLRIAHANAIDTLDTAVDYGESESVLGHIGVSNFNIVSKLPSFFGDISTMNEWVKNQSAASLERLGLGHHAALVLHRPRQLLEVNGVALYQALWQLKARGLCHKIGISVYSPVELDDILSKFDFDLVQLPFNLLDRRFLSSGWLQKLKDKGIEVHTRSTFLQGLLLMPAHERPTKFGMWRELWAKWDDWITHSGLSRMQACMAYVLGIEGIDKVVIGADSPMQLVEIIESGIFQSKLDIPDLTCQDERLINPSNWGLL